MFVNSTAPRIFSISFYQGSYLLVLLILVMFYSQSVILIFDYAFCTFNEMKQSVLSASISRLSVFSIFYDHSVYYLLKFRETLLMILSFTQCSAYFLLFIWGAIFTVVQHSSADANGICFVLRHLIECSFELIINYNMLYYWVKIFILSRLIYFS